MAPAIKKVDQKYQSEVCHANRTMGPTNCRVGGHTSAQRSGYCVIAPYTHLPLMPIAREGDSLFKKL
jgi:hypothetical protein